MADEEPRSFLHSHSRKRASKACLACRARKVRCDISQREGLGTCTNCSLDQQVCIVKPRPSRYRVSKNRTGAQSNPSLTASLPTTIPSTVPQTSTHNPSSKLLEQECTYRDIATGDTIPDVDASIGLGAGNNYNTSEQPVRAMNWDSPIQPETKDGHHAMKFSREGTNNAAFVPARNSAQEGPVTTDSTNSHVTFLYYPFLKLDGLSQISPDDINFLEKQSCLRIPTQPALDEFMREYFLHVHPSLPLLDEGRFWDLYSRRDISAAEGSYMSLFILQAMLFASCSFVSLETIRKLGFASTRSARAAYFRRAKLLFDFNGEQDSTSIAQGALLMTYNASTQNHKILNSLWLGTAIQFAKDAGAHRYHSNKNFSPERKSVLKRLWWCCILRDRILPLGVRRSLNISSTDFDFNIEPLTKEDFENEIFKSRVYDASTKLSLVQLLLMLCELAVSLSEVIMLVYPVKDSFLSGSSTVQKTRLSLNRAEVCKRQLHAWFERATARFPTPAGINDGHESMILYTNVMYMYYYSAVLAIYHHEFLVIVTSPILLKTHFHELCRSKSKVEEAAAGITANLKELVQLKLAKHLPISVVAYAALPLVLHVLDVKLSASDAQSASKKRQLDIYTKTMKGLQSQYDGTDEVLDLIKKMVDYMSLAKPIQGRRLSYSQVDNVFPTDHDSPKLSSLETNTPPRVANEWGDVLLRQPGLYLRIAVTIDLTISKGHFPTEADFPTALQSENNIETRFPLYRIIMGDPGNSPEPPTNGRDTNRNTQYSNTEAGRQSHSRGCETNQTLLSSSAVPSIDQYLDPADVTSVRMFDQSPQDLSLSMYAGTVEGRFQGSFDALFDYPTNWADTTFWAMGG